MKSTQFFVSTLKEAPADAEVVSHKLMMRAGLIKRRARPRQRSSIALTSRRTAPE